MKPLISVQGLTTGPSGLRAVRELDMYVHASEVVALLGPNGAGKSVTLAAIAGHLPIMAGDIDVLGSSIRGEAVHHIARRGLALLPADRGLFLQLTAAENLRLYRNKRSSRTTDDVLDLFRPIRSIIDRKVGLLSGGEQQMLALACSLITDPKVLLIDELSRGLAPVIVQQLLPKLRIVASEFGVGVLVVEQHIAGALSVADRAYVLNRGHLMITGTADELRSKPNLIETAYLGSVGALELGD